MLPVIASFSVAVYAVYCEVHYLFMLSGVSMMNTIGINVFYGKAKGEEKGGCGFVFVFHRALVATCSG